MQVNENAQPVFRAGRLLATLLRVVRTDKFLSENGRHCEGLSYVEGVKSAMLMWIRRCSCLRNDIYADLRVCVVGVMCPRNDMFIMTSSHYFASYEQLTTEKKQSKMQRLFSEAVRNRMLRKNDPHNFPTTISQGYNTLPLRYRQVGRYPSHNNKYRR